MSKTGLQIILVPSGLKMEMHRTFGYGRTTINRALSGTADTSIARKIRAYALSHGGVEVRKTPEKYRQVDSKTWVNVKDNE